MWNGRCCEPAIGLINLNQFMIAIRLPKNQWGKGWRAMIEVAPVRLVAPDPIYEVLPAHLEVLKARGITYEVVAPSQHRKESPRHATPYSIH